MKKQTNVRYLVQLSLLAAIELVMAYTPLGYLRVFALEITFLMVPVTLGAILLGPAAGAVLGGVFGLTSFATCFSVSGFGDVLLSINPVFTFLVCVPTRILAGWLAGVLFKAIFAAEVCFTRVYGRSDRSHRQHRLRGSVRSNESCL